MNQLQNRKERLLGKKGFSLVELIIVIAIMAVLVAILVPQYLKYVDKSKQSADNTTADELYKATQVAVADEAIATALGDMSSTTATITITMSDSADIAQSADTAGGLIAAELASTLGANWEEKRVTSNTYKADDNHDEFVITITTATGVVSGAWG